MTATLAIIDDYLDNALRIADWSRLQGRVAITVFTDHLHDEDAIVERLGGFDIICAQRERTPFPRSLLARLPRLKLLCSTSQRNFAIDVAAARELGKVVCGTDPPVGGTVDLTWGLIFALLRRIPQEDAALRAGRWQVHLGRSTRGLTMGVLGLGTIGSQVARIAHGFGMSVIAWSPNLTAARADAAGVHLVDKATLFAQADVLTLHLALSARTAGIVGATDLARMKRDAVLINTSRGPLVDEAALAAALHARQIAGAAIDTFSIEPLPQDHPLRRAPNTILTPHLGYVTEQGYRVFYGQTVENVAAFLDGRPIRVMNPAAASDASASPWL
ncbi:MAG: D-2-hydroxyacid dehydrogenase family protein [Alphaproteobacteria bacterium]|nr:D-2-hydroxyacid dehydrogenase family protein [Alphaproteobacteria bacterium]